MRILAAVLAFGLSLLPAPAGAQPAAMVPATPTTLTLVDGVAEVMAVRVTTAAGTPVASPQVQWAAADGTATASIRPLTTGLERDGYSAVEVRAAVTVGAYQITASLPGVAPVVFQITNVAGGARTLRVVAGGHQSAVTGAPFAEPLTVRLLDLAGLPVTGVPVTFAAAAASGASALLPTTATTDTDGYAQVTAVANAVTGRHHVDVTAPTVSGMANEVIALSNLRSAPASLQYVAGTGQTLVSGGTFGQLEVRVLDAAGAPMSDVAVTFLGPTTGAGLGAIAESFVEPAFLLPGGGRVFSTSTAAPVVFANTVAGPYQVVASVAGLTQTVSFTLTNALPSIGAILPNGAPEADRDGAEAALDARFGTFGFQVVDTQGLPMAGVTVNLTPPATGPTLLLDNTSLVTDGQGFAVTSGRATTTPGFYRLRADVAGAPQPASMLMLNRPAGYRTGEALADIPAFAHDGSARTLRGLLASGRYLILDVCAGWCVACRQVAPAIPLAVTQLAAAGVPVSIVPVLAEGNTPGVPAGQADAAAWRQDHGLTDLALHVNGDLQSPIADAAGYILGAQRPGYPTYLLVGPDGTVLDRHAGALNASGLVDFVLRQVPSELRIASVSVSEGDGAATLTVTRTQTSGDASVRYATSAGSASSADFAARSGQLMFAAGVGTATITVPISPDDIDEPTEQFTVTLSSATGASIAAGTATVTITDDDPASRVSVEDQRFQEGTGTALASRLLVRVDRPSAFPILVNYQLAAGTATAADVTLAAGALTIRPGELDGAIPLAIVPDRSIEVRETFTVRLLSATNAQLVATSAVVSIVDDDIDTVAPVIEAKTDVVLEVRMAAAAQTVVKFTPPAARDTRDGAVPVVCSAASGLSVGYGVWPVTCRAEDRVGNIATSTFNLVVRLPTVAGALFAPGDPATPLVALEAGRRLVMRVNAGAFQPRARVSVSFVDGAGCVHALERVRSARDGGLEEVVRIPKRVAPGLGQVIAESENGSGEYNRAWFLTVLPADRD